MDTYWLPLSEWCQQQLNTNTDLKKQRLNTDTPNVFHFCPAGLVQ